MVVQAEERPFELAVCLIADRLALSEGQRMEKRSVC